MSLLGRRVSCKSISSQNAVERTKSVISRSMDVVLPPNFTRKRHSEPTRRGSAIDSRCYADTTDTPVLPPSGRAPGLAMGFLTEDGRQRLDNKLDKAPQRTARLPELLQQITALMNLFPQFPKSVLIHQVLRLDGNCWEVYSQLQGYGWEAQFDEDDPDDLPHSLLVDHPDIHMDTPYFFGPAPPESELKSLLENKPGGTFFTFYRYIYSDGNGPALLYFVCFKNQAGEVVERPTTAPNVPEFLKGPMRLTGFLSAPIETRLSCSIIPFLERL